MKKLKKLISEDDLSISSSTPQSSTVEGQYTEPIPVDLLIDIFLRVPTKSIARFRCLSKSWANIFRGPYFTDLFLKKSLNHPRLLFTIQVDFKLYFFSCPQTPQNTDDNSSLVATRYHHTQSLNGFTEISSLLQGLVCRQFWRELDCTMQVMCNPVTGEFLTLPEVEKKSGRTSSYFGYDPTYKQFKVLRVSFNFTEAHVLTLKTGKHLWRMTKCTPHFPMLLSRGICIDGVLHYLADSGVDHMIVCFDVRSEKFSYIIIDDESMITDGTLVNYKGKLGVVQLTEPLKIHLRLWLVEQDHAGKYEWSSSIYELPRSFKDSYIVGMTGTSDIVLSLSPYCLSDPFYVYYYNVERKTFAKVKIQGFQEFKRQRPRVDIFQDYVENIKFMECL